MQRFCFILLSISAGFATPQPVRAQIYETYGVHNPASSSPCTSPDCIYPRKPGEPPNPVWPQYWQSAWTMYRVFNHYQDYPPPYPGKPPAGLREGADYQTSHGATYYDSTWRSTLGEGAMAERYEDYCLPIFPLENHYSCAFISLGNTAFFVAGEGRPDWMPKVCLFSPLNHPPRTDFIAHLPYSAADSARIGHSGQGYSFWVSAATGKVVQVGASPDRTAEGAILFGYGFQADATGEVLPQSFYFSGYPLAPANAPIVSQNYTGFQSTRPAPSVWEPVAGLDADTLPLCQLFNPPTGSASQSPLGAGATKLAPTWDRIGRWRP